MKANTVVLNGKPKAGILYARFDEGEVVSVKLKRRHLLYRMPQIFGVVAAIAISAQNVFATHLSEFCLSCGGLPGKGVSYDYYGYDGFPLQIAQVVPEKGVLVTLHRSFMECDSWPREIFIKMSTHGLVDDMPLPNSCYRCIGTITYKTVFGRYKTVSAFEPDEQRYQVICEQRAKLAKEEAEEAARKKREREEKQRVLFERNLEETAKIEIQEQGSRKDYLRSQLYGFCLDPKSHFLVSRKCLNYVEISTADIRLKDERLKKMEVCRDSGDWLGLFANAALMLQDKEVLRQILNRWHGRCKDSDVERARNALWTWRKTLASLCRAAEGANEHCHSNYVLKVDAEIAKRWKFTADDSAMTLQVYPPRDVIDNVCDVFGALEYNVRLTLKGGRDTLKKFETSFRDFIPNLPIVWCRLDSWAQFSNEDCEQYPFFVGTTHLIDECKVTFAPGDTHTKIFVADDQVFYGIDDQAKAKLYPILNKFNSYELEIEDAERQFNIARDEINKIIRAEFVPPAGAIVRSEVPATIARAKVDSATAKKDRTALQKALKAMPEADAQKSGDRERRLAKIMQDTTVVKLHEKYTGRKCAELLTEFKREWKDAANAPAPVPAETPAQVDDSELQTIDNRIAELKNLCHAWALRKRGLSRTPPAVLSAEKEIKELEKKKSAIRMDKLTAGSRARNAAKNAVAEQRNAVYLKYKKMVLDDLVAAIEGCAADK